MGRNTVYELKQHEEIGNGKYYFLSKLFSRSIILFALQITRRYAEFSAAIVSLNESFPDEKVLPFFVT